MMFCCLLCIVYDLNHFYLSVSLFMFFFKFGIPARRALDFFFLFSPFLLYTSSFRCAPCFSNSYLTCADGQSLNSFIFHCIGGRCKNPTTWREEGGSRKGEAERRRQSKRDGEGEEQLRVRPFLGVSCPCLLVLAAPLYPRSLSPSCHDSAVWQKRDGFLCFYLGMRALC